MKSKLQLIGIFVLASFTCHAQNKAFDPLLDPDAVIETAPSEDEIWESRYMWYPGQLAAYYQQQCARISKERCVNVGYPGKFFAPVQRSWFKKSIKLDKESRIIWEGPDTIIPYIDNVKQTVTGKCLTLPAGRHVLMFEVITNHSLPCLILQGEGVENPDEWQASMDGEHWTLAESAAYYNKPQRLPDTPQEMTVRLKPKEIFPLRNAQNRGTDGIRIGKNGYALIDFFHLETGALSFRAKGEGTLTVRVGETPEEALERDESKLEQYPFPPIRVSSADTLICLPQRALRYAAIECDEGASIDSICFDASVWPVTYQMQFETDDEYINDLFRMSSATLHASMHRFYLDGLKRDFLPWSMDALVSTLAGDYLFGDQQVSKNGISIALMPLHPQKSDIGIPDYPLHALFGLKQNYLRYGDLNTSLQYKDRIIQLLDFYASIVDENGFVHGNYGDKQFGYTPGWSTYNGPARKGIAAYAQIMLYYNYQTGAYFARLWKEKKLEKKYSRLAERLKQNIFKYFWDNDRKVFINGTMNDGTTPDKRISHHAQYWAILADIFPQEAYDNLFERVLPNLPNYYEAVSYEKGYEFLAYAKAGRIKELWEHIYRVWGDWMKQGHTRFPENLMPNASRARQLMFYNRPYGLSLCHGANGVPVVVGALRGLLGFSQSDKCPNEYTLRPELLHLKRIHARIPVKEGYISVRLNTEGESTVTLPEGCTLNLSWKNRQKTLRLKKAGEYKF